MAKKFICIGSLFLFLSVNIFLFFNSILAEHNKEDLKEFLISTSFIDSDNSKIINKASDLTKSCGTNVEKARLLFEFVRDSYNKNQCESFIASEILECGGNSCRQRSILLATLCRAVGIPARLHLQKVTLKDWKDKNGNIMDISFAHGITGIYLNGEWHLYESVGNKDKWIIWSQDEKRGSEMPVEFFPDRDCLFQPDKKIIIKTLPVYFADRTEEMIKLIERIDSGK
jgi:hypothetical protein